MKDKSLDLLEKTNKVVEEILSELATLLSLDSEPNENQILVFL
jgi:hypothetical protein